MGNLMPTRTLLLAVLAALTLSACVHRSPRDLLHNFSETQVDQNVWVVNFQGYRNTSEEVAKDFMLLHSAELALENGFNFFVFADKEDRSEVDVSTVHAGRNSFTTVSRTPVKEGTIRCFTERPEGDGIVYDAAITQQSIIRKYGFRQDSKLTRRRAD